MFDKNELVKLLSDDNTTLTLIIPKASEPQCTKENFELLAAFINEHNCRTLKLKLEFTAKATTWAFIGQAIASTTLQALDLKENKFQAIKGVGFFQQPFCIDEILKALNQNKTLYSLDVRDTQMSRSCVDGVKQYITNRPLWLEVKASQATLDPPTSMLVDSETQNNTTKAFKTTLAIAQVFKSFNLPKDLFNLIAQQLLFFSTKNHPINNKINSTIEKAYNLFKPNTAQP